ncbi:MAG: PfkB family carbohydrate kinase [Chloroflexota bacterium]
MTNEIDYLLIGHMTADLTPDGRVLGGTVSYAARTVTALGLRVGVVTSTLPDDPLLDELRPYTVDVVTLPAEDTSTFENVYTDGRRQQYIRGVAKPLTYDDVPVAWRAAPLVHFGPLTGEITPSTLFPQFEGATRLLTAQGLLRQWGDNGIVHFKPWADPTALAHLDWLVLSEEDIEAAPELESTYAAKVTNFVLTRAERGGTHYYNEQPSTYDTPQVEVLQPTGAGDVFAAALLAGLHLLDGDATRALAMAAALGANAVTRPGLEGTPTIDEAQDLLHRIRTAKDAD